MDNIEVVITGPPRSGTTALCEMLNRSREIFITDEAAFFHGYDAPMKERLESILRWDTNNHILSMKGLSADRVLNEIGNKTGRECMQYFKDVTGCAVVGDKYPTYVLDMSKVVSLENIRVVVCTRNPIAIVASMLRRAKMVKLGLATATPWATSDYGQACELALRFYEPTKRILHDKDLAGRMMVVDYDTMSADAEGIAKRFMALVGIDGEVPLVGSEYRPVNISSWEDEVDLSKVDRRVLNLATEMGYL